MEKVISIILFVIGTVFLVMAIFGAWRYLFTMGICFAAGLLVREDADDKE